MQDFVEIKSFQKPPLMIKTTMDGVCILMNQKGKKVSDKPGVVDYWDDTRRLLTDPAQFIKKLEKYDKENISEATINKMKQFLAKNKNFQPSLAAKASLAAEGLCKWCLALYEYYFVYKSILPLREDLDKANKQFNAAVQTLEKKREQLA